MPNKHYVMLCFGSVTWDDLFGLMQKWVSHLFARSSLEQTIHREDTESDKEKQVPFILGLYSPTILKNILCLFLQDFQIGM